MRCRRVILVLQCQVLSLDSEAPATPDTLRKPFYQLTATLFGVLSYGRIKMVDRYAPDTKIVERWILVWIELFVEARMESCVCSRIHRLKGAMFGIHIEKCWKTGRAHEKSGRYHYPEERCHLDTKLGNCLSLSDMHCSSSVQFFVITNPCSTQITLPTKLLNDQYSDNERI